MRAVNVTELRNHLPKYLLIVQKGSEILITSHGHIIARIVPPIDVKREAQRQLKELRKHSKVTDAVSPIDEKWDADK